MQHNSILEASKHLTIQQNVSLQVIAVETGKVVQEHTGHNSATNSLLFGIAHHLIGDFIPNEKHGLHPAYTMLSNYVPRYISLGTMGLINQNQDAHGLPAGIGDIMPGAYDSEYQTLWDAYNAAKAELEAAEAALAADCQYWPACDACAECSQCAERIGGKKQAVIDAQAAVEAAYQALVEYSEELRFVEYMKRRPGYGADGYDAGENNYRDYFGLGYAFTSYDNTEQYLANDVVTFNGTVYECIQDTPNPCGPFDGSRWKALPDTYQPSKDTTVKLELISPTFPREAIAYRDVVPEYQAELPKTIDVVFSAMISTGALKQFRPAGQDYIFITEAGLWSKRYWEDSGENGLLAGYRIVPPNEKNWDMTVKANRDLLKRQILRVGRNQVVQVVWKIQIGAVDAFESGSEPVPATYYTITFNNKLAGHSGYVENAQLVVSSDAEGTQIVNDARTGLPIKWTTRSEPKDFDLSDGEYYLVQTTTPEGYYSAPPVHFQLVNGIASKIGEAGDVTSNIVTIYNEALDYYLMQFALFEAAHHSAYISDAILAVAEDAEGTQIVTDAVTGESAQWVTTSIYHDINLRDGEYYLVNVAVPEQFYPAPAVHFEIVNGTASLIGDVGEIVDNQIRTFSEPALDFVSVVGDNINILANELAGCQVFMGLTPYNPDDEQVLNATFNSIGRLQSHSSSRSATPLKMLAYEFPFTPEYPLTETYENLGVVDYVEPDVGYDTPDAYIWKCLYDMTLTEFLENAVAIETTVPDHPLYVYNGYYYCDKPIGFWDNQNLLDIVNAVSTVCADGHGCISFRNWVTTRVTTLDNAFNLSALETLCFLDVTGWDTSRVTSMNLTFANLKYIGEVIGLNKWDTSSCTELLGTFRSYGEFSWDHYEYSADERVSSYITDLNYSAQRTSEIDLSNWSVENVTTIQELLMSAKIQVPLIWNTASLTTMHSAFRDIKAYIYGTINDDPLQWDMSHVTDMSYLFADCQGFLNISQLDTSHVTNMEGMFKNCSDNSSMPNAGLALLDYSNVVNMKSMFEGSYYCITYNYFDEINIDTRSVTDMSYMYHNNTCDDSFGSVDLPYLNTSSVVNFSYMYAQDELPYDPATYLYLADMDTSSAVDMSHMFDGAYLVYGFENLDVSKVTNMSMMFANVAWLGSEREADFSSWHINPGVDMSHMFDGCTCNRLVLPSNILDIDVTDLLDGMLSETTVAGTILELPATRVISTDKLEQLKAITSSDKPANITKFIAHDLTFDTSVTSLANMFSQFRYLREVELDNWDTAHIQDFSHMFDKMKYTDSGVLDFSSLNNWNVSSGVTFTQMCNTSLIDDPEMAWPNKPFEQGYTFPDWNGTWNTTGLYSEMVEGTLEWSHVRPGGRIKHSDNNVFGTFTPN